MKTRQIPTRTLIGAVIATMGGASMLHAAPLSLVQYPAGSAYKTPIPNVVVSVDNSGSMGATGMAALRQALQETFDPVNLPDGSLRLAYQSMWSCNTIPSNHASCRSGGVSWNTMRELTGTTATNESSHRGQFFRWISTLGPENNTPTHTMMHNAGEYLRTTGANNPWNKTPGTADSDPIACRRAYHILMTDGGWNQTPNNLTMGNADGTARTLPDGTSYDVGSDQTRIYRDAWGYATNWGNNNANSPLPTVSDMAFYYWATDLQPGIANNLKPLIKKSGQETFTAGSVSKVIDEYWNPRNNPATWQNMQTYTIGYNNAATWPNIATNPMFNIPGGMYGGDFNAAIVGSKLWRDPIATNETGRQEELWHIAINSRSKLYPAQTAQDLKNAFKDIVTGIVDDNTKPITSFTSSSGSVSRSETESFQSGYNAIGWSGYVSSDKIGVIVGNSPPTTAPNPAWGYNSAKVAPNNHLTTADKLDALANVTSRLVLSSNDITNTGISFAWTTTTPLSINQQDALNIGTPGDGRGKDRVDFIRGDRTKEANNAGGIFRERTSRQGDIVNSAVWFAGAPSSGYSFEQYRSFANTNKARTPMLYVGGNDGMLHGFSAVNGEELIAYVPQGVIPNLKELTNTGYSHRYYVDGSPFTGDVNVGDAASPDWRTYLAGTLGAGGKGYFVLDVTRPGTTDSSVATNFSTGNAASLVVMDKTGTGADPDTGHIFGNPVVDEGNAQRALQIAKTNDGRWALITGNGYNSTNERPVLFIQYLTGAKELKKLSAIPVTTPKHAEADQNGLSTPQLLDINDDGIPDVAYAGDLRGNLWKFDISSNDPTQWNVAFGGNPLFVAQVTSGNRQPITTAPVARPNRTVGGLMLAFGTGRAVTENDRTDISQQTVYSVLDNTRYEIDTGGASPANKGKVVVKTSSPTPTTVSGRSVLMQQTIVTTNASGVTTGTATSTAAVAAAKIVGTGVSSARDFWALGSTAVTYTCPAAPTTPPCVVQKGWYFDLPESGERVLNPLEFFDGSNLLEIMSEVPASGGNTTSTSAESCEPSPVAAKPFRTLLSIERGTRPQVQLMDQNGDGLFNASDKFTARMTTSPKELRFSNKQVQIRKGSDGKVDNLARVPELMLRPGWRQLK